MLRIQPNSGSSFGGLLQIYEADTLGSGYVGLKVGASHSASINYTLPTGPPASNKVLQSTSTGIMSWVAGGGTDTNIANTNLTTDNVGRTLTLINSGTWGIYDNNASIEAQLEKIITQKYYASFFVDYQSWFEKRRTGYPILPRGSGIIAERVFPNRVPYPTYLQSLNPENLASASASMGGDNSDSKVWWAK